MVENAIPDDGNACSIGFIPVKFELAHDCCFRWLTCSNRGDALIFDDKKGFGALDARDCARGGGTNTMSQAAEFIALGLVPCLFELRVAS